MKTLFQKKNWTRLVLITFLALLPVLLLLSSQSSNPKAAEWEDWEAGCTSILVGRLASTDGSVMTAHSCDGNYRTWVKMEPHLIHEKTEKAKIYHGLLHNEFSGDMRRVTVAGEIPQVEETYAFFNTAYPCMNEKQLAIGETTIRGRRDLRNTEGMFLIEELERLALERCDNARDAIRLIGKLVKEYGYCDSGECITIADPKEVWHFEIFGAGPLEIGAVWAAVRIPDDHVGVSANIPRISELNLDDEDNFMASENVHSLAEEMGWWDPNSGETFKFWKAYSGRKPFSTREFFILSTMAPTLNLDSEAEELPFSVKPDKKVSVQDLFAYYRQTYEGTDLDVTKNLMVKARRGEDLILSPAANPWMSGDLMTLLNTLKPESVNRQRQIAIAGCSYSEVLQCRDWLPDEVGGIAWFSFDNPGQSPRIPIFSGVTELLPSFEICGQHKFRTDSASWYFRRANRLATVRWGATSRWGTPRDIIAKAVKEFEDRAFAELPGIEKKAQEMYKDNPEELKKYLTQYTNDFARAAMNKYWELGDLFWTMFTRGF